MRTNRSEAVTPNPGVLPETPADQHSQTNLWHFFRLAVQSILRCAKAHFYRPQENQSVNRDLRYFGCSDLRFQGFRVGGRNANLLPLSLFLRGRLFWVSGLALLSVGITTPAMAQQSARDIYDLPSDWIKAFSRDITFPFGTYRTEDFYQRTEDFYQNKNREFFSIVTRINRTKGVLEHIANDAERRAVHLFAAQEWRSADDLRKISRGWMQTATDDDVTRLLSKNAWAYVIMNTAAEAAAALAITTYTGDVSAWKGAVEAPAFALWDLAGDVPEQDNMLANANLHLQIDPVGARSSFEANRWTAGQFALKLAGALKDVSTDPYLGFSAELLSTKYGQQGIVDILTRVAGHPWYAVEAAGPLGKVGTLNGALANLGTSLAIGFVTDGIASRTHAIRKITYAQRYSTFVWALAFDELAKRRDAMSAATTPAALEMAIGEFQYIDSFLQIAMQETAGYAYSMAKKADEGDWWGGLWGSNATDEFKSQWEELVAACKENAKIASKRLVNLKTVLSLSIKGTTTGSSSVNVSNASGASEVRQLRLRIEPSLVPLNGTSTAVLIAEVTDTVGRGVAGVNVSFAAAAGNSGGWSDSAGAFRSTPDNGATDANGRRTVYHRPLQAGAHSFTASMTGATGAGSYTAAADSNAQITLVPSISSRTATSARYSLRARILNSAGQPVETGTVRFRITNGTFAAGQGGVASADGRTLEKNSDNYGSATVVQDVTATETGNVTVEYLPGSLSRVFTVNYSIGDPAWLPNYFQIPSRDGASIDVLKVSGNRLAILSNSRALELFDTATLAAVSPAQIWLQSTFSSTQNDWARANMMGFANSVLVLASAASSSTRVGSFTTSSSGAGATNFTTDTFAGVFPTTGGDLDVGVVNGQTLWAAGLANGSVAVYTTTGTQQRTLSTASATSITVWNVAFSPDGTRLAATYTNRSVSPRTTHLIIWNTSSWVPIVNSTLMSGQDASGGVSWSANSQRLAVGFRSSRAISIFTADGGAPSSIAAQSQNIYTHALSPDGAHIAAHTGDGLFILQVATGAEICRFSAPIGSSDYPDTVTWRADGKVLYAAGPNAQSVYVFAPFDDEAPVLALDSPADQVMVNESMVSVSGQVTDEVFMPPSGLTSTVNQGSPTPVTIDATGRFSFSVPLSYGRNLVALRALDLAGNERVVTRTVTTTYDAAPPTVVDMGPSGTDVDPATNLIEIVFSTPMVRASVESAFSISPVVAGTFEWAGDSRVVFKTSNVLAPQTSYTVGLAATIRSQSNIAASAPFSRMFSTGLARTAAPTFSLASGTYPVGTSLGLSVPNPAGVTIRYTTDGQTPTETSLVFPGTHAFASGTLTIKARAFQGGFAPSPVVGAVFATTDRASIPTVAPAAGTYPNAVTVQISSPHADAVHYYTLDGSEPNASSLRYTAPFMLLSPTTVRAISVRPSLAPSEVTSATYVVRRAPIIILSPQSVTVSAGAAIAFTTIVRGGTDLVLQWRRNGTSISGATGAVFSIPAVGGDHAGSYELLATSGGASVTSLAATLSVTGASVPATPSNLSPASGAINVSLTPTLTGNAFSDPDGGDTHAASQWQVLAATGTTVMWDSGEDATNMTSVTVPTTALLAANTTYRWQVRYKDNRSGWSAYSTLTSFTTGATPVAVASVTYTPSGGTAAAVARGDTTPSLADGTDFGVATIGAAASDVERTFTITNTGAANLTFGATAVTVTTGTPAAPGTTASADFTVTAQPATPVGFASGSNTTTFKVKFSPKGTTGGTRTATVVIASNETATPYAFAIKGAAQGETPPNDNFANAIVLAGNSGSVSGTTIGATRETGEDNQGGLNGRTVWYRWTPATSGAATFTLTSTAFAPFVNIFPGTVLADLGPGNVGGNHSSPSVATIQVTAGTIYHIAVVDAGPAAGAFTLTYAGPGPGLPTVATGTVSQITTTSARLDGTVIADGGATVTERGYVFGTSPSPTTSVGTKYTDGSGLGTFATILSLTPLTPNTTYFWRAYATNSVGTSYGAESVFTTDPTLVAYYRFDGDARDLSGTGNSGTAIGVTFVGGKNGQAAHFNGSAMISVPDHASLDLTTAMTFAAWVRIDTGAGGSSRRLFDKITSGTANGYGVNYEQFGATDPRLEVDLLTSGEPGSPPVVPYSLNEWVHLAIVANGGTQVLYRNGIEVDRRAMVATLPTNALPLVLGAAQGGAAGLQGDLDEFRLYNRALSAAEVIRLVVPDVSGPLTVTTLAGLASAGTGSTDGVGSAARFNYPEGVAVDGAGNIYVADQHSHTIRKITSAGTVTTFAGTPGLSGTADGTGSAARFYNPQGLAADAAGNVYVADTQTHIIRKITSGAVVTTLAGTAGSVGSADGTGAAARFKNPTSMAVDTAGNLYVADTGNHTIRKISSAGVVTTVAGLAGSAGSTNGTGSAARFNGPTGVAIDSAGNVIVADQLNHLIRKITSNGVATTLAGVAGNQGSVDGVGSGARFYNPFGIAADPFGNVYVSDQYNYTLRRIAADGTVTTVAGLVGTSGSANGEGTAARFYLPAGLATDAAGNVYVADYYNHTIRKGVPAAGSQAPVFGVQPLPPTAPVGGTVSLSVAASGTPPPTYRWQQKAAGTAIWNDLADGIVSISGSSVTVSGATSTTLTLSNVVASMSGDQFRCIASNGVSPNATSNSATLTVTKIVPVVTWSTPSPITYGTVLSATQLNASAGGVAGTFAYTPAAGTVLGAGSQPLSVTFTPTDSATYSTATQTQTLVVNKAALTATAENKSKVQGAANPELTIAYSGFVNGETKAAITEPTINTTATTSSPVGPYPITLSGGSAANYTLSLVNGTLTVAAKIAPTITWPTPVGIAYGTALTATQLNASAGGVAGTFAYTPAAGGVLGAGSHPLSVTFTPTDTATYSTATQTQTLVVNKAALTATAENKSKVQGAANPTFTITYAGFVNGDTKAAITEPTISTTATTSSPEGTYPITLAGGSAANYTLSLVNGTLTVTAKIVPTIAWPSPTAITYGTALTATQLNASAGSVAGVFAYSPAAGAVLGAGSRTLNVTFTPNDTSTYATATATQTLNVNKAALTATATNLSKTQGAPNPALTITYAGFVNGDTKAAITEPIASTTATTSSPVGSYEITLTGGNADNYALTLVNGTLTVGPPEPSFATRILPSFYAAGKDVNVSIQVAPGGAVSSYAVEDSYPAGWTFKSVGAGLSGQHDAVNKKVKFGPFFDNTARTLTYVVTAPPDATTAVTFGGIGSADGTNSPIGGATTLGPVPYHPADKNPADFRLTISEVTTIGAAWKRGDLWGTPPAEIPIGYVTRAGYLWKNGEVYTGDPAVATAPNYWIPVPLAASPAVSLTPAKSDALPALAAVPTSTSVRSIVGGAVMLVVTPDAAISVYAVEELIPAGLTVSGINNSGAFDAVNRKVKWGPFFDNSARTLVYTVSGADGTYTIGGVVSLDGADQTSTGQTVATLGPVGVSLVVVSGAPAGGTVAGGGTFAVGSSQDISATASAGYYFTGWSDGNTSPSRTVTVPAGGATFTANFALMSVAVLPVSANVPTSGGNVSLDVQLAPAGTPTVTSNAAWLPVPALTAESKAQWTIVVSVPANTGAERTGTLSITAHGLTRQVTVTQAAIVLLPPANVAASDGLSEKVAVTWTAASSATGYDVYRAATNDSAVASKLNGAPVVGTSYDDTTVAAGVGHYYWVKSRNGTLESAAFSNSDAGMRPTVVPPSITTAPLSRVVRLGGSTTLAVVATGGAPLTYQWKKDTVAIDGATSATLAINNAQFAQAGAYTVTVTNTQGSPTSAPAQLAVVKAEQSFTGGYTPGVTATIGVAIAFAGAPVSLGLDAILPDGWGYAGGTDEPETKPVVGTTSVLGWAWSSVPTSPIAFTYRLNVPAGDSGGKSIRGRLVFRQDSGPSDVLLLPDPLELNGYHSADTGSGTLTFVPPPNSRIELYELTRVIELYNTRNGTVRTGAYAVATTATEDGFAIDPARAGSATVSLTRYHSADTSRDGRIGLVELTRVIELFNYRSGTSRTGEYHVQPGSEDGFAPGPASVHPTQ